MSSVQPPEADNTAMERRVKRIECTYCKHSLNNHDRQGCRFRDCLCRVPAKEVKERGTRIYHEQ